MKIVIYNYHIEDAVGGAEIQCDLIAEEFLKQGHEILYITPFKRSSSYKYNANYEVISVGDDVKKLMDTLQEFNPSFVYWRAYKKNIYRLSKLMSVDYKVLYAVSAFHDVSFKAHYIDFKNNLGLATFFKMLKRIAVTYSQLLSYKNFYGVSSLNSKYLSSINNTNKAYISNAFYASLETTDFSWERPYVVWVANLKRCKRPEVFLRLARELDGIGVDFLMIGRLDSDSKEFSWVKNKDFHPNSFYYLGEMKPKEATAVISNSLFHVHTCEPEGFGNVFLQAWMSKKPSVSFLFDPDDVITKNDLGFFCEGNWELFKQCVLSLINNASLRTMKGEKAYLFYSKNYKIEEVCSRILKLAGE